MKTICHWSLSMRDSDRLRINMYVDIKSDILYSNSISMTRVIQLLGNNLKDAIAIIMTQ